MFSHLNEFMLQKMGLKIGKNADHCLYDTMKLKQQLEKLKLDICLFPYYYLGYVSCNAPYYMLGGGKIKCNRALNQGI